MMNDGKWGSVENASVVMVISEAVTRHELKQDINESKL